MRWLILRLIQLYRRCIPPEKRRRCLFRESCSEHVERVARERGGFAALKAFLARARSCKPGYSFEWSTNSGAWQLLCADGSKIPAARVSAHVAAEYQVLRSHLSFNTRQMKHSSKGSLQPTD